jgi:hypothetical protein
LKEKLQLVFRRPNRFLTFFFTVDQRSLLPLNNGKKEYDVVIFTNLVKLIFLGFKVKVEEVIQPLTWAHAQLGCWQSANQL